MPNKISLFGKDIDIWSQRKNSVIAYSQYLRSEKNSLTGNDIQKLKALQSFYSDPKYRKYHSFDGKI